MFNKIIINKITAIFTFWTLTLLMLFAIPISPQQNQKNISKGMISGILIDAQTKMPIEFANFILTSLKDTSKIIGTVSGKEGKFELIGIPMGIYSAKISLVGYKSRTRKNIILSIRTQEIKLDTVLLMPTGLSMKEIQIIAERDRIVYDKEDKNKIIVNPDRDWGNNALDLLENTPMVDVDIETGAISLLGKKGTVIYIDGNPAKFSGIMSNEDLKLLSAFDIDKFELILNPSVEYGESTGGGVINIITKKTKATKYNGNISSKLNTNNLFEESLGGGYNLKDITIRSNYNNYYSKNNSGSNQSRQVVFGDTINYLNQLSESENKSNGNALHFNISLNVDQSNLISSNTMYRDGLNQINQNYSNTYTDNINSQNNGYNNLSITKSLHKFFTEGISYNKLFTEKGHSLNAAFLFSNNNMNLENNIIQNQFSFLPSSNGSSVTSHNTSVNSNDNFNWGVNYKRMINKYFNLFLGYRGGNTKLSMNDDYYILDPYLQSYNEDLKRKIIQGYNDFNQDILFGLNGTVYDIQYDLGLRAMNKYTSTENKVLNNSYQNSFTNYDPKVGFTTNITDEQTIGINFMRMTQYPQNKQLNPYLDYSDSTNIVAGNPELKPFVTNSLGMNYNISKGDFWGSAYISYLNVQNMIGMVTTIVSSTVLKSSYQNISSNKGYSIGVFFRQKFAGWLEIDPNIDGSWSKYNSPGISSESKSWGSSIRSKVSFSDFKFQMDLHYSSPSSDAQQKTYATFYANAAAKLLLLNKQLSITFRASDIFNSKNRNSGKFGTDFTIMNNIRQTTRIISLELAYYFQSKAVDILEQEKNDTELPDDF